jgi:beta-ketoacyl-acyl-carrier-protein synthase II
MNNRVVITGMGIVSPIGNNIEEFRKNLFDGKSGVDYVKRFNTKDFPTKIAAEVKNFTPEEFISKKDLRHMDLFSQYALVSSIEAVRMSNLNIKSIPYDVAVVIGCGIGGFSTMEEQYKNLLEKGVSRVSPFTIPMIIPNIAGAYVSIYFGVKGPNLCPVTACSSGANAIGEAFNMIKHSTVKVAIAGGTESAITPLSFAGFCSAKAMSRNNDNPQEASRPFDKLRDGFVMGEGAGILVLEELEHALNRKAKIYGEIISYSMTSDAYHITAPSPNGEGIEMCMKLALKQANIIPDKIDYINAHGTSTQLNDKIESKAIKNVFGKKIPVSSIKSILGHLLGAAGSVELISCILAINNNLMPPTINYKIFDEECDLDYVPNKARKKELNYVLSNNLGFGGHNVSLILKKYLNC